MPRDRPQHRRAPLDRVQHADLVGLERVRGLLAVNSGGIEGAYSLARAAVEARDWQQARKALEPWLGERPQARFYSLMAFRPERPTVWGRFLGRSPRATSTIRAEWPRIRTELDAGRPVAIGLVRVASNSPLQLTRNHQVLAYGYTLDGSRLSIAIYDPNHPLDDTVELRVELDEGHRGAALGQSSGESLVAFFRAPYRPKPPIE